MTSLNDLVRDKIRETREAMGYSQRDLAQVMNIGQGTISDAERGRTRITLELLSQFADALRKPLFHFLPSISEADLSPAEQHLVSMYRELGPRWQAQVLNHIAEQLRLYRDTVALLPLTDEQREAEAWDRAEKSVRDELPMRALTMAELEDRIAELPEDEQLRILGHFISILPDERFTDLLIIERQQEILRRAREDEEPIDGGQ